MKTWRDDLLSNKHDKFELGNIWSIDNNLSLISNEFIKETNKFKFNYIAGIETKGIILASAVSAVLKKPLLIFRKKGKITYTEDKYQEEYTNWKNMKDGIEIEKSLLVKNMKILVIDDLAQTLETFKAVFRITEKSESIISAYACIGNISNKEEINGISIISLVKAAKI